jgi:hypothetical protein
VRDAGVDFQSEFLQFRGEEFRRAHFAIRQFRMLVQVAAPRRHLRHQRRHRLRRGVGGVGGWNSDEQQRSGEQGRAHEGFPAWREIAR